MSLFTFILEYDGGTYVSQVDADTVVHAKDVWAAQPSTWEVAAVPASLRAELRDDLVAEEPVPLTGLIGAWCLTASPADKLVLVNIIETAARGG